MSEKKNKKSIGVDLDFSDLDGRTVQEERKEPAREAKNLPAVHIDDPIAKKEISKVIDMRGLNDGDIFIPVGSSSKHIKNVTGQEFLTWLLSLTLLPESWNPDPNYWDGPDNLFVRLKFAKQAIERHVNMTVMSNFMQGNRYDKFSN